VIPVLDAESIVLSCEPADLEECGVTMVIVGFSCSEFVFEESSCCGAGAGTILTCPSNTVDRESSGIDGSEEGKYCCLDGITVRAGSGMVETADGNDGTGSSAKWFRSLFVGQLAEVLRKSRVCHYNKVRSLRWSGRGTT